MRPGRRMIASNELGQLRLRGMRLIATWNCVAVIGIFLCGLLPGYPHAFPAAIMAVLNNIVPSWMALRGQHDSRARLTLGIATAINPAIYLFVLQNHAWQMDMHMFFLVNVAALTLLCDWRPLAAAAAVIVLHHILVEILMPGLAFEGGGNLARVLLHGIAVVAEVAALSCLAIQLRRLIVGQAMAREEAERAVARAEAEREHSEAARARAVAAEADAQTQRERHIAIERQNSELRRHERSALAQSFEDSVMSVMSTVEDAAQRLVESAKELGTLAWDADRQAGVVAGHADKASEAANDVAAGAGRLAESITQILANVTNQVGHSAAAQNVSARASEAMRALGGQTCRVEECVSTIDRIARTTNLVALNAAIEAARSGSAGAGFKVVAAEVKALAGQASTATNQISDIVGEIAGSADSADEALRDIVTTLDTVAAFAGSIQKAVETQQASTFLIERSVATVASITDDLTGNIKLAAASADAARSVSDHVRVAANGLLEGAQVLRSATHGFVSTLRAA